MFSLEDVSSVILVWIFIGAGLVIALSGTQMAKVAEKIAEKTGLGQAIVGAVFVGISTSLSGTILSFYSAADGHPSLAISNAVGGIAAQTAFLALADMTWRRINLEHAAASVENLAQGALLIILLAIPLTAAVLPQWELYAVSPASIVLVASYIGGIRVVAHIKSAPMWAPRRTYDTQTESEESAHEPGALWRLFVHFALLAAMLAGAGLVLAEAGAEVSERTGLSETLVGGLFTSITTSLPELVTTIAAVRRGALNLAVGDIIGGNSFDVLFLSGADLFYRNGSLFHEMQEDHVLIIALTVLMTGVLMLGMLRREKRGPAGIGFESVITLCLYGFLVAMLLV